MNNGAISGMSAVDIWICNILLPVSNANWYMSKSKNIEIF
jgi:hypothetical protein